MSAGAGGGDGGAGGARRGSSSANRITLRAATAADAPAIAALYVATVHAVNAADYSPEQIAIWAAGGADPAFWLERQARLHTVVAVVPADEVPSADSEKAAEADASGAKAAEVIVGFCEYLPPADHAPPPTPPMPIDHAAPATAREGLAATGHAELDCLYVHHAWIGRGVGTLLLADLEARARRAAAAGVWLEACITARPFFERRGYQLLRRVDKPYRGQTFTIFEMQRPLSP